MTDRVDDRPQVDSIDPLRFDREIHHAVGAALMEANSSTGGRADPATQGTDPVSAVSVVRVNESSQAKPDAAKKADSNVGKALEWTKAVGMPLVTLIVTVVGGYYFTSLTREREARASDERQYVQLLAQREQTDAPIRKELFGKLVQSLLFEASKEGWDRKMLQLELLTTNFDQSLDLAPLYKDVARQLHGADTTRDENAQLKRRLDQLASNQIFKQINRLARRGYVHTTNRAVALGNWEASIGKPFIDAAIAKARLIPSTEDAPVGEKGQVRFAVEVIDVALDRNEVQVRVRASIDGEDNPIDFHFWVGRFTFPLTDNFKLQHGLRAAVVMTEFYLPPEKKDWEAGAFAMLHLVVFPAASASFKDREDYDDIMLDMLRTKNKSRPGF